MTMPNIDPHDAEKGAYIEECTHHLHRQVMQHGGGWPEKIIIRRPKTLAETEALDLWLNELRTTTGARVAVAFPD